MNKKDLLDNIRDYSPKEIADAIKSGIVTFYELKSGTHGQFTPMLQRQVQQKLAEKEESATNTQSEASQTQEEVFAQEEAVTPTRPAEPEPFKPIEPEPEPETAWHPEPEPQPVQIRLIPCPECGWLVSPRATECPSCGMPLSGGSPSCHAPAFDTVQQTQQQVPTPPADYKFVTPTETPNCINKFNWGALTFGWLWGVFNGVNWALITILLGGLAELFQNYSADPFLGTGVPLILSLSALAINIFLGIRGNKLAWKSKKFASAEAFDRAQTKWSKAAFIVIGIIACIVILTYVL